MKYTDCMSTVRSCICDLCMTAQIVEDKVQNRPVGWSSVVIETRTPDSSHQTLKMDLCRPCLDRWLKPEDDDL